MPKLCGIFLAACCAGLLIGKCADATDPPSAARAVTRDAASQQQTRARVLIFERAQHEARARTSRMAARKRAGISLLRPVRTASSFGTVTRVMPIDHGIRILR